MNTAPLSSSHSYLIFGLAAVLLFIQTRVLIPWLSVATTVEPVLFWFIVGGLGVFFPLLVAAWFMLEREGGIAPSTWRERLRFRRMNAGDYLWAFVGICAIIVLSGAIMHVLDSFLGQFDSQPPFMRFEVLGPGRYWILLAWLPFWLLNIMGEEILWRGVMLPRMETALGRWAWLHHGLGWTMFHVAFGWQLLLVMLPILFLLPWIVQKRGNTWIAVVIHAVVNGPAFVLIALGML